jgi:hypothetical protein
VSRRPEPRRPATWRSECARLGIRFAPVDFGVGVFAARAFALGESIGVLRGRVIDDPEYESAFAIELSATRTLEPDGPLREINHSCEPNCGFKVSAARGTATLFASTPVRSGDELTVDYGWPVTEDPTLCACGSEHCRIWIVAAEELELWPFLLAHTRWDALTLEEMERLEQRFRLG